MLGGILKSRLYNCTCRIFSIMDKILLHLARPCEAFASLPELISYIILNKLDQGGFGIVLPAKVYGSLFTKMFSRGCFCWEMLPAIYGTDFYANVFLYVDKKVGCRKIYLLARFLHVDFDALLSSG